VSATSDFPHGRTRKPTQNPLHCGKYYVNIYGMPTPVEELIQAAADARRIAQKAIELAVREARAAGWSWDQISAALGGRPNGETLRRNFGSGEEAPTRPRTKAPAQRSPGATGTRNQR
jgi:hypothetical protein